MSSDATQVPAGLRVAAAWTWRVLLLGVGIYALVRVVAMFQLLVAPVLIALLLVALIRPLADAIGDIQVGSHRLPRSMAALLTMLVSLAAVVGLMTMIGQQVTTGFPSLRDDAVDGVAELQRQLANSPLHLSSSRLDNLIAQATTSVRSNSDTLVSGALAATSTAGHVLAGFFLVMFSSYFFLSGGDRIWAWMVRLFPRTARARVDESGRRAWATLTSFVRATMIVALVDALGVGIVAAILGVPLALPLGVLVFLGAFVPIVGALLSGSVAVLVALVAQGPVDALLMLGGVLVVQQVESHVLQPFLLGRAVRVHPLAVILAIAAGVLLAGIPGALFAVPLLAVINVVAGYLSGEDAEEHAADPEGERPSEVQIDSGRLGDDPDPQPPVGTPSSREPSRTSRRARMRGWSRSRGTTCWRRGGFSTVSCTPRRWSTAARCRHWSAARSG